METVGKEVVDAGLAVHMELGPGLLESVYEACLAHELGKRGLRAVRQVILPIRYKDLLIDGGLRLDLVVKDKVIIELKSVEKVLPIHEAQIITYLRMSPCQLGFLMNFNVKFFKEGLKRFVYTK